MTRGILYVISAPSGAGKTSLVCAMRERIPDLIISVSHTTRPQRPGEIAGRDYHFVDRAGFEHMIREKAFLEYARVFDHYYGTAKATVEQSLSQGRDVVLEIDWQGARQVRTLVPESVSIFILPPSRETLEQRLRNRAQDSDAIIARRMQAAISEMSHYAEYDYLVINDEFNLALSQLHSIVTAQRLETDRQTERLKDLLRDLLG